MSKASEQTEFARIMGRETPTAKADDLNRIMRLAREHGRIAERECNGHQKPNGDWDDEAAKRDELRSEKVEADIRAICERIGCKATFSGDPRGATVKLIVPSGYSNSFGGEGICVPQ